MPRKTRIEGEDNLYHVINRGNYRTDIFESDTTKTAFEETLFKACERSGWTLYAYVIMRNHYHLALGTPRGNLISGMQWLQSTFANRFNRFRDERGHVFQGRYKSFIIEPGAHLAKVVNYIHLNPVRAGISNTDNLERYTFSSFTHYLKRRRHSCMSCEDWLGVYQLKDTPRGWREYRDLLALEETKSPEEAETLRKEMTQGWCIGSRKYKQRIVKGMKTTLSEVRMTCKDVKELNELHWKATLHRCVREFGKSRRDIQKDKKSADWKCVAALVLKETTSAPNHWIAKQLTMGTPKSMSNAVYIAKRDRKKRKASLQSQQNMDNLILTPFSRAVVRESIRQAPMSSSLLLTLPSTSIQRISGLAHYHVGSLLSTDTNSFKFNLQKSFTQDRITFVHREPETSNFYYFCPVFTLTEETGLLIEVP